MKADIPPFRNEPAPDWSLESSRDLMTRALQEVRREFGKTYPAVVGGKAVRTRETIVSVNPAKRHEVVGEVCKGDSDLAERAVSAAAKSWESWRRVSYSDRVACLLRAAEVMRRRKFELAAWEVFEAGKTWREAHLDVVEAIDFLEYYARQMLSLGGPSLTEVQTPGEANFLQYVPRGLGLVIGIWNFPCAINTGMNAAAIVTGNSVVFKPASVTPVIGYKIFEIFREAGVPNGVLNYLPGTGESLGEYVVSHPDIAFVVLTGSKEAGLRIARLAGEHQHRHGIKKVVAETGGKNAIIVDSDADLDEVTTGTLTSWLSYQGQKCSACSRLIALRGVHDALVKRLVKAAKSVRIGPPEEADTFLGPLISEAAVDKVRKYVSIGKKEAHLALEVDVPHQLAEAGYFVGPVLFTGVSPQHTIAQEEIFGPVLSVIRVESFEEALAVANSTGYALTGGVFSSTAEHVRWAAEEFDVGNLYINRAITGSIVGRQPFGGHRGSGTGPKAGGPNYLKAFMNEKVITQSLGHGDLLVYDGRRSSAPTRRASSI